MYNQEKADRVHRFLAKYCSHTKGEWAGMPFKEMDWQKEITDKAYGTLKDDGYRQYRIIYCEVPKKNGKSLAVDTPIPTTKGWRKMGDVGVGDCLFDERGDICNVIAVAPIYEGHKCYRIEFTDNTAIVADAEHLWKVERWWSDYGERLKTTEQLSHDYVVGKNKTRNYRIRIARPIAGERKDLPIPPYVLGIWLGDGNTNNAVITCANDEILDYIHSCGVETRQYTSPSYEGKAGAYLLGNGSRKQIDRANSIQAKLRELKLLGNKHIPLEYLWALEPQRFDLLQGLMDSDGHCEKTGQCEFTTTSFQLAKDVVQLIRSLGFKTHIREKIATLNGRECGTKYRISFFAYRERPPFRLTRKKIRLKPRPPKDTRAKYRHIKSITEIPSVPVRCIAVDSPSRLFLAGDGFIPTHNTEYAAGLGLYQLLNDDEMGAEVYSAAADREQAGLVYFAAKTMVENNEILNNRLTIIESRKRIVDPKTNSFYQVLSAEAFTKHGLNPSAIIFDELHAQPNDELWTVLTSGTDYARRQQLIIVLTTAGVYDPNSIWWRVRDKAIKVKEGIIDDPRFLPVLYIADHLADPSDEKLWVEVNPALDTIFTLDKIREEFGEIKDDPIGLNNFKRFRLNIPAQAVSQWMPPDKWDACGIKVDEEKLRGRVCYAGLDLSSTTDITALIYVFPPENEDGKYAVLCRFFVPGDNIHARVHKDRVPYDVWAEEGHIITTDGNALDYGAVLHTLMGDAEKFDVLEVAFDRWGAAKVIQDLQEMGFEEEKVKHASRHLIAFGQGFQSMSAPMKELFKLVISERIAHGNNPVLKWMANNVYAEINSVDQIKPNKGKSTDRIDGVVALIMALDRALRNAEDASAEVPLTVL